jgi:hypothetical protein
MQSIIDSISIPFHAFWVSLVALVVKVFSSVFLMLKDVIFWAFEQILDLLTSILQAVNLHFLDGPIAAFSSIPEPVMNVLGLLGFGDCLTLIGSAILVRVGLQLIPFTRLGS